MDTRTLLRVQGSQIVGERGPVRLRGVGIGGWLMMENFITGFPGTEHQQRDALVKVLGTEMTDHLLERLLEVFFAEDDVAYLADLGVNCIRLAINYRHLEDDLDPGVLRESAFRHITGQ